MEELMALNIQLVILGTGDIKLEKKFNALQKKYPNHISLNQTFDETLAHMIEAGSDMFLMPSAYEPCGMNQMYSLKYGTIPIVFNIGGLGETIKEFNPNEKKGNGFVFNRYTAKDLVRAVKRAVKVYKRKDKWQELQLIAMKEDFSWNLQVEKYLDIYHSLLEE
jgi:starch synthase